MGSLVKWFSIHRKQKKENEPASEPVQEKKEALVPAQDEEILKRKAALALSRDQELWKRVIRVAMEHCASELREQGTKGGKADIGIELPGTENLGIITVEPDSENDALLWMNVKVVRKGVDHCRIYYDKLGSYDEILALLEDERHVDKLYQDLKELSEKLDEHLE